MTRSIGREGDVVASTRQGMGFAGGEAGFDVFKVWEMIAGFGMVKGWEMTGG